VAHLSQEAKAQVYGSAKRRNDFVISAFMQVVALRPFLDAANSPALSRAFYVPGWSAAKNSFGQYRLSRRKR
jgi:hypothetical protein